MRIALFFVLVLFGSVLADGLSIHIADRNPTQFMVGEKAFIAVEIEGVTGFQSEEGQRGIAPYVLEKFSDNASWLRPNGRPEFNSGLDNAEDHWQNNQTFWLELSGIAPAEGDYSGKVRVRNVLTGEQDTASFAFTVIMPPSNYLGVIVAMHDSAASYGRQMDIYSSLINTSRSSRTLQSPYVDYYATRRQGMQPVVNVWEKPSNGCVQILDCGEGNFVIRHRYSGNVSFAPGARRGEFKIGYNETSTPANPYYFSSLPEKDLFTYVFDGYDSNSNSNIYADYSYAGSATNYTARAMRRNLFFNPYEALYDHSGNRLWGSAPSWFSEQSCPVARVFTDTRYDWQRFRTNSVSGFCIDSLVNTPPEISFPNAGPDTIYEGEDYFLRPMFTDAEGDSFTVELVENPPDWIEIGTPADYWDDYRDVVNNNVNTVANRRVHYIRSKNGKVRNTVALPPGVYHYTVKVTDVWSASSTATREIRVLEGSSHPAHTALGLAVLVGDETWFKKYQLDIASGVVNYSGTSRSLSTGWHYDYYGTHAEHGGDTLPVVQHWYVDTSKVNVSYTDCGEKRFRIRYTGRASQTFLPNRSYLDNKAGLVYRTTVHVAKDNDWSIGNFYADGDTLRRRRYAPEAPLYDGNDDGMPLWGTPPDWAPDCENPPEPGSSSSSSYDFVSSSSFNPYGDLAVRFADNSSSPNAASFKFDIVNRGDAVAPVGGYELRFYYNGNDSLDASRMAFDNYQNLAIVQSRYAERCDADLFVYKVKLSDDAQIQPGASLPPEVLEFSVHLDGWQNYDWRGFASWADVSALTDNPKVALFDADGNLVYGTEMWRCEGYASKTLKLSVDEYVHSEGYNIPGGYLNNAVEFDSLIIRNDGDSSLAGPVYVDFFVTHPAGRVPVLVAGGDTLSVTGKSMAVVDGVSVVRISSGNKHTFRFTLADGLSASSSRNVSFRLLDQCLEDCSSGCADFAWNLFDDWSAMDGAANPWNQVRTDKVAIHDSAGKLLYGAPDPSAPSFGTGVVASGDSLTSLTHRHSAVDRQVPNRTDAIAYSGGQLLSGGDFETDWLHGWELSGSARSVRGESPQGSRHVELSGGAIVSQPLPLQSNGLLADSGAVLSIWHTGNVYVSVAKNGSAVQSDTLSGGDAWMHGSVFFAKTLFTDDAEYSIAISSDGIAKIDDAVLIPGVALKPSTYAVRFTSPWGEELETRAYDGAEELLVTDVERDAMGRTWKSYLPFALPCKDAADCNSERKTAHNPGMASNYYTAANPDYPDADGVPYSVAKWKPDPMATKDVEGAPGRAFGIEKVNGRMHLVRAFSSGVNFSGINLLDSASLNSAVAALRHGRVYDGDTNYRAARDANPTHLWELNIDQDGRRAFTVKDGESRIIVSGSLDGTGKLLTRSVNELDARGNVVKSHPPMSCSYSPTPANCVAPSTYEYDSQSRIVRSWDPDAGETRTFYDIAGRIRATQTQRQIDSGSYVVIVYDHLDRPIYTGEWKPPLDSGAVRAYFNNVQNKFSPTVDELTQGTVTRTFYDRMPARDTLGVELYPAGTAVSYTRGRVAAVVSDVVLVNGLGGTDSIVRVSNANSYDKYGRVLATYTYDPTLPADSLKLLAVENEYDLGGKVTRTTRYPYGYGTWGHARAITERYTYDRLGRVDSVFSKNGGGDETLLARYEYYPTGSVKSVHMGNILTIVYTYHISGALRTARVTTANGAEWYSEMLHYEDCGDEECTPQYNGNISYMAQRIAHSNRDFVQNREVAYYYDQLNRLTKTDDLSQDYFDDFFEYDAQGRITVQRRAEKIVASSGGEYAYYDSTNKLKNVADGMGGTAGFRNMGDAQNFVYDRDGNLIEDKSKNMMVVYDWRGMPTEFTQQPSGGSSHATRLVMRYDGSGRRISKTAMRMVGDDDWDTTLVTHYTGIGTEVRENLAASEPVTQVVVNMPQGLGRYGIEDADHVAENGSAQTFEWFLKNHLGSTMLVYGTGGTSGGLKAAYDYRSFGEQIELTTPPTGKVTENFTGKEKDDETELNYFGARYLDPMLGMWIFVDPARQFASPYLYAGNGYNPVNIVDPDGNDAMVVVTGVADSKRYKAWSGAYTRNYEFNRYRVDVYLNTEKWKPGQTYKDVEPSKSYWGTRDAWHPEAQYNKAVISGSGYVRHTKGDKGKAKNPPWLVIGNVGYAKFKGEGPKGETTWEGESLHDGAGPANSSACVTFTREDWLSIRADLVPDIDAGNPVKIEFEPFTPEEKSW